MKAIITITIPVEFYDDDPQRLRNLQGEADTIRREVGDWESMLDVEIDHGNIGVDVTPRLPAATGREADPVVTFVDAGGVIGSFRIHPQT